MIEAARGWDNQLKLISTASELDSAATGLMQLPS
jgi:hypothetical protein